MLAETAEKDFSELPPLRTKFENDSGETFSREEWAYFMDEVNKQVSEGNKSVDFGKATRNARYVAKIDRGIKSMKEGRGRVVTDEELRRLVYGA